MEQVVKLLKDLQYTISSCESITGGLFSKTITDVSGASQVFKGSIVSYANEIKINLVGVKKEVIDKYGVVSQECALAMARNARKLFNSSIAISFTGNAGPDSLEDKSVGLVYIAIDFDHYFLIEKLNLKGSRAEIRNQVVEHAQKILEKNLIKIKKESPK